MKNRATEIEWMDSPNVNLAMLKRTLRYIHFVNIVLGGNSALFSGLKTITSLNPQKENWRILDLGCGHGGQLSEINKWAKMQSIKVKLVGIDNNPLAIEEAKISTANQSIEFYCVNALDKHFDYSQYDIVIANLFLHHLTSQEISQLFVEWNHSKVNILIGDLERSYLALVLFKVFSTITFAPSMAKHDGALSIKKGFLKKELKELSKKAGFYKFQLKWIWAFRLQLLLLND